MTIARSLQEQIQKSSWIRKMFEAGQALKDQHGEENVFDFSLGSPSLEPPEAFQAALRDLVNNPVPGMHRYMNNAGFPATREAMARMLTKQEGLEVHADDVIMTVGAAGAINVTLTAILDPGDEVIVLAPFFVEYLFYIKNHGGETRIVETAKDFDLDLEAIDRAITERTKAIIINTPNNSTGLIYSQERLGQLARLLARREAQRGRNIHLLVDTPYARITYDGFKNPRFFEAHPSSLIAHSYSKELGLAGQRIGFLAINSRHPDREALRGACTIVNRTLGYVNAPALMQMALARCPDACVDVNEYCELRDLICEGLADSGLEFSRPQGAFYLFAKTPIEDDLAFCQELQKENVLVVPGSGFGRAGYIRIAYCVSRGTIERAIPHFNRVVKRVLGG